MAVHPKHLIPVEGLTDYGTCPSCGQALLVTPDTPFDCPSCSTRVVLKGRPD